MFNFFKKLQGKTIKFDIYDESTWDNASDSLFLMNARPVQRGSEGKNFTEKEMAKAIDDVIRGISSHEDARVRIQKVGRKNLIRLIIGRLDRGDSFFGAVSKMSRWLAISQDSIVDEKLLDSMTFNILDIDTWKNASSAQEMLWNGKEIFDKDGNPFTEEGIVDFARATFNFLERNGDIIPKDKKNEMLKNLLNRMENPEYHAEEDKKHHEEQDAKIPDGLFNPRDPETYKYAKSTKPLVIDGVQIFHTYTDVTGNEKKEVKEPETEKGFVTLLSAMLNPAGKGEKWDAALQKTKEEYQKKGITNPNDQTPGYIDRANDIYKSFLDKDIVFTRSEKDKREYIEKYVKRRIAECTPRTFTNYGGYGFSEAQMEVLDGLPVETIEKIGCIMSTDKSGSKLKQEIFNSLAQNGRWVVELRNCENYPEIEEGIMLDYYLGFELDSESEIYDFFNSRPYLTKRPKLKQSVIETAIKQWNDLQSDEE